MSSVASVVAAIGWDPEIRGVLAVAAGVIVLMGSVYLVLGTNLAWRLGFLVAGAAFFGWIAILAFTFWMKPPGNGPGGRIPAWEVSETIPGDDLSLAGVDDVRELDAVELPGATDIGDLSSEELDALNQELERVDWELVSAGGGDRAELESVTEAAVGADEVAAADLAEGDTVIITNVMETGGEPPPASGSVWDRWANKIANSARITSPPHYAVVQLVPAATPEPQPGQPPADPEPVPGAEAVSVVFVRDLGQERLPAGLVTIGSLAVLGVLAAMMHKRDQLVEEHRAAPLPATTGSSNGD